MKVELELMPWIVPNFVTAKMPARPRQEGFSPDALPKWSLAELDANVLAAQCDEFRAEVFRKAWKDDPANAGIDRPMEPQEGRES